MACNHDIRERKFTGTEVSDFSLFFISFVEQYLLHIPYSVPHLVIDDLPAHSTPFKRQIPQNEV
jgi:hypothetical protein